MEKIAALSKSKDQVANLFYKNVLSSGSHSKEFLTSSYLDEFKVIYAPFYVVSIDYRAEWTASFGFDRIEHYTHYRKVHSNGSYHMEPETKQKTVTDWHVKSGQTSGSIPMMAYGGQNQPKIGRLVENSFSAPKSYSKSFQDGSDVELEFIDYDKWKQNNSSRIGSAIESNVIQNNRQGDRQKSWRVSYKYEDQGYKIYIPVYSANLIYKNKKTNVFLTSGSLFGTNFSKTFQDDKGFLEENEKLLFWCMISVFVLMTYFTFWSIISGGIAYFFHRYVMDQVDGEARLQYEQIIESRFDGSGFIGPESLGQQVDIAPDSIWRTEKGLKAYFGSMLGLVIFVAIMAVNWSTGSSEVQVSEANDPVAASADGASPGSVTSPVPEDIALTSNTEAPNSQVSQPQESDAVDALTEAPASQNAPKPSFNCAVGTTPAEKLICGSYDLAALDVEMAGLYKTAMRRADSADVQIGRGSELNRSTLVGNQSRWIHGNNNCRDSDCLQQRLTERIDFLNTYSPR
jgi:hypothetical protein